MKQETRFWNTTWFRVTLGTLVSILFLYLALKDVSLGDVAQALARTNYVWVLIAIGAMALQSYLRAVRWILLFYPLNKGMRVRQMFGIVLVTQMLNIIAPWRIGDLARIYLAGEIEKRSKVQTLATLGTEKIFDTLMLVAILLGIPLFMALPAEVEEARAGFMILLAALFALAVALILSRDWLLTLLRRIPLPWVQRYLDSHIAVALDSLDVFRRWDILLELQALSLVMWLLGVLVNLLTFFALNLQVPLIASFVVLAITLAGGYIPSSPGKVGVFPWLCTVSLDLFGIDKSIGLTYGILLYLIAYGTPVVLGLLSMWWGGINLRRVPAEAQ